MIRKSLMLTIVGACTMAFAGSASAVTTERVSATQKGSLLMFSKVEIKWDASGNLIQDTFLDITNDYPADVTVQAYFINGDTELQAITSGQPPVVISSYEPGWNTADCRFTLTGNQPHFWSAAKGSDKCQAFTVLDSDGPGRPDPDTGMTTRVLRGYVIMYAVKFFDSTTSDFWANIRWNHLKGDALVINYADGSAWEYNAWAFQGLTVQHGDPIGNGSFMGLGGSFWSAPYDKLLLDFYATGSTALSSNDQTLMVNTDLTLHAVSADLRQDGVGPVLTKVEAEIWNEFETKFSGTRRCICCWDEALLSDWVRSVAIPNHFTRAALRTDKGKARLDGVASTECNYRDLCGETATTKRCQSIPDMTAGSGWVDICETDQFLLNQSEDAALLGVVAKVLTYSSSGDNDLAGMNLVGMGTEMATIRVDRMFGPEESNEISDNRTSGIGTRANKGLRIARNSANARGVDKIPAE